MRLLINCLIACAITGDCLVAADTDSMEPNTIRVVVISGRDGEAAVSRLKEIGFRVTRVPLGEMDWDSPSAGQVIVLPSNWTELQDQYKAFQEAAPRFHKFIKKGGGLVVCQPNPYQHIESTCSPDLLPYPMTFYNWYDEGDAQRVNATHAHYITEDLKANDLPFPADKVLKWDERYKVLALGAKSESPSLLVCTFGKGRVVVQTGNESPTSKNAFPNEVFRRMISWAAGCEPARFR